MVVSAAGHDHEIALANTHPAQPTGEPGGSAVPRQGVDDGILHPVARHHVGYSSRGVPTDVFRAIVNPFEVYGG
jgi:hypothetical protein